MLHLMSQVSCYTATVNHMSLADSVTLCAGALHRSRLSIICWWPAMHAMLPPPGSLPWSCRSRRVGGRLWHQVMHPTFSDFSCTLAWPAVDMRWIPGHSQSASMLIKKVCSKCALKICSCMWMFVFTVVKHEELLQVVEYWHSLQ